MGGIMSIVHACCVSKKLREQHDMPENVIRDCCVHYWCGTCARAQELRFVDKVKELQLALAIAGQSAVNVAPVEAVNAGPVRQAMAGLENSANAVVRQL